MSIGPWSYRRGKRVNYKQAVRGSKIKFDLLKMEMAANYINHALASLYQRFSGGGGGGGGGATRL